MNTESKNNMAKEELKKLVNIRSGYSTRTRLTRSGSGGIKIIRPADISMWQPVDYTSLQIMDISPRSAESHYLKSGEILFWGRSGQIYSVLLDQVPEGVVAAGSFLVLTVHSGQNRLLPEYLNWFLNSRGAVRYFQMITGDSPQRVVTKAALENLNIPLPKPSDQFQIVKTWNLLLEEKELTMERLKIREELVNAVIEDTIEESVADER